MSAAAATWQGVRGVGLSLLAGLRLLFFRPLPAAARLRPGWHFWPLLALQCGVSLAIEAHWAVGLGQFSLDGLQSDAFVALLVLAAAQLAAVLLQRPVLVWTLAVLWMASSLWLGAFWAVIEGNLWAHGWLNPQRERIVLLLIIAWWWLALLYSLRQLVPVRSRTVAMTVALLAALLSALPAFTLQLATYRRAPPIEVSRVAAADEAEEFPLWPLDHSAEQLLYAQPALLEAQLARLQPQDPERNDLYLLAFGGDGNEDVFRNEVDYVQQLFDQRFGTRGRSLALLNHPDSTERKPLATLSNLRLALQGVAQQMDTEQDLLLLFLTSHGSDDHQLYVDLLGLPLDQIEPDQLRAALDDSGIRWRVLVVSACYSGGFIDALADPRTLIITAAREDRSSFGCGPDSDFTYFGRAYFIHALNQVGDLQSAFKLAAEEIAEREAEEERLASEPQIRVGAEISARLEAWQQGFELGPVLEWPLAERP